MQSEPRKFTREITEMSQYLEDFGAEEVRGLSEGMRVGQGPGGDGFEVHVGELQLHRIHHSTRVIGQGGVDQDHRLHLFEVAEAPSSGL
ncbi:hypothetical protein FF1_036656 [Malus domestica]